MFLFPLAIAAMDNETDKTFMEKLYMNYWQLMYWQAVKILKQKEDAEDLVNECCIKLIAAIDRVRKLNEDELPAYITRCVKNAAIDLYRKQQKLPDFEVNFEKSEQLLQFSIEQPPVEDTVLSYISLEENLDYLQKHMGKGQFELLVLKYQQGQSNQQLAQLYNTNADNIRAMLSKVRKRAQKWLEEKEELE